MHEACGMRHLAFIQGLDGCVWRARAPAGGRRRLPARLGLRLCLFAEQIALIHRDATAAAASPADVSRGAIIFFLRACALKPPSCSLASTHWN